MSKVDRQVEGILMVQDELAEGILNEVGELDGGDASRYSDKEKQSIIMGTVLNFSEMMMATKSVLEAREAFIKKNSHYSSGDNIKTLVDSSYYAAVRTANALGEGRLSVYEISKSYAETIIDQIGWESTSKNISLVAGYLVLAINDLEMISKRTGGIKAGGNKKKILIVLAIIVAAILFFTVGPFGNNNETDEDIRSHQETSVRDTNKPVYEEIGDVKFQVNINKHAFIEAKDYTELSFANYSEDGEQDWNDEEKKKVWDNITYGDEYSNDERVFQDNVTEDIVDFVIINIGEESEVSNLDDYIEWYKENNDSYKRSEDFTLGENVHACKIYSSNGESENVEISFIYNDRFYLIRPFAIYEETEQFIEDINNGIKFTEEKNEEDAISWNDAGDYVGETVTIKGRVAEVTYSPESSGKPVFIDIGKAYPSGGRVTVTIWDEDQGNFDVDPNEFDSIYSIGDTIYVNGTIETYEDAYSIKVSNPRQIKK